MKKTFLDLEKVHIWQPTRLAKIDKKFARGAAYRSDGKDDEGEDDDDDEGEKELLLKKIKGNVRKQLAGKADKAEIEKVVEQLSFLTRTKNEAGKEVESPFPIEALRTMADEKTGAMAKITDMGLRLQQLETANKDKGKDMSVRGQVKAWMEDEENKKLVQRIKNREQVLPKPLELDLRVASPMLVSTVNSGNSPYIGRTEIESGVTPILRFDTTFWDFLTKGRTNAPTYVWVNKTNPLGAAAFIGPGVAKPGISFELIADTSVAKKIADSAKAGTELLEDIDGMTSFIMDELRIQVMQKVNETLMTGTASSTVPAGIQTLSQNYAFYTTAATIKTTNPTIVDAIRAAVGALRSGKIKGPIVGFINPVDSANMDMAKAVDSGVYMIPRFANGLNIGGATIVEDQNITPGYIQIGFMDYYRIKIYKDFTITWGYENDDFTKNLVTAVGEMRLHQMFNSAYAGAFLYDTFANIQTAITAA